MAKLDADAARKVAEAESTGGVMEEGIQVTTLIEVQTEDKNGKPLVGPKGPYWIWVFKNPADAPRYAGWQHWLRTSLSEAAAFKMKEVFEAFGVPTDTDTDELIGRSVRVAVGQYTKQEGPNAGQLGNSVESVLPLDESATGVTASGKDAAKEAADLF